jgi:uncharacterized protein (UPF0332 family)
MQSYDYYELAEWLCQNRRSTDGYRSAVSRAYYSAFHAGLELLATAGVTSYPKNISKHEAVPDILQQSEDFEISKAGAKLHELRGHRNDADYDLTDTFVETAGFAQSRLREALEIIKTLSNCKAQRHPGGWFERVRVPIKRYADIKLLGIR